MQLSSYYNYIQEIQDNCLIADLSPINLNTSTLYEGKDKEMEQKLRHWVEVNDTLKPSHRWTNGPLPLKTIEANG